MDPIAAARAAVNGRFALARTALLAGSTATGRATATSDLDIVVVLPDTATPYRETVTFADRPVELFVHSEESLWQFIHREAGARRSPLLHMCGENMVLIDHDHLGGRIQQRARSMIALGPPPLTEQERGDRRYLITGLLDDLRDGPDLADAEFVAAALITAISELVILDNGGWLGRGKWLGRRLAQVAPDVCADLLQGYQRIHTGTGPTPSVLAVERALAASGGALRTGYRRE